MNRPPKGDEFRRGNYANMMFQPSANDNPDMTIKIREGSYWINNEKLVEYAGGISPKITVPKSGAKWVVVALNASGRVVLVNGIAAPNNPECPALTQNMLPIALVYVKSSTTMITNDMVYDARPMYAVGGYPTQHAQLQNRNKENSHSIGAITGLQEILDEKLSASDVQNLVDGKANYNGTISASFTLNVDDSGVPVEHCGFYVNRGSQPKVGIKYNEDLDEWQYTNDGTNWLPMGASDVVSSITHASTLEYGTVKLNIESEDESIAVAVNDPKYLSIDNKVDSDELTNYFTKEEVLEKLENKLDLESTYSKDDINSIFVTKSSLSDTMLDTYKRSQIDSFLSVKANAAQVYSKTEVDTLFDSYFTKEDVNNLISDLNLDSIRNFNVNAYYKKSDVDALMQNVVTNTYTRTTLDAMLANKADAIATHEALDGKADKDSVYTKEAIDIKLSAISGGGSVSGDVYSKSEVDALINARALLSHNHTSGDILTDAAHKFVSDTQIETWNNKQDKLAFVPENSSNKGQANGYVPLNNEGKIPLEYIPSEISGESNIRIFNTYEEMVSTSEDELVSGHHYVVLDATGDPSGITGKATYLYYQNQFVCMTNGSGGTASAVEWDNILNKPSLLTADNVYTKEEVDAIVAGINPGSGSGSIDWDNITNKPNILVSGDVYTKEEIDNLVSNVNLDNVYNKTEINELLAGKADANDINNGLLGTKEINEDTIGDSKIISYNEANDQLEYIDLPAQKELQEFENNGCKFIAYDEDALTFEKTGANVTITKNKFVKSVRFSVAADDIPSNNRISIDYDAASEVTDMLDYDYANVFYMQLMGSRGATKPGTNVFYPNDDNPHYCECAVSFGNQAPVVVKITY